MGKGRDKRRRRKLSAFAKKVQDGMRAAARTEVQAHLDAGRDVHGIRDGEHVIVKGSKPVVEVDDETLWNRIRQRYSNMRFRNFTLSIIPYGPKVKASTPEELQLKADETLAKETKKKPEN